MGVFWVVVGILAGLGFGWFAAGWQWRLYRNPEHREHPASGRKLLVMRIGLALACATAGGLALRPEHYDAGPALLTLGFAFLLLVLASTDFERRIIPNRLSYPAIAAAAALYWAWPDRSAREVFEGAGLALGVAGVLFGIGIAAALALGVKASALGLGDVKLMLLLGLLLGWPAIMSALLFGVVLAGIPGVILTVTGKGREFFSYGPYLVLGAVIPLLFPANFV
jgi:leader peptidase (prepilin peptidase)/N-methyltransferase